MRGVDPLLAKTLFWWTGHAIVYFWVLPAYISWYAFVPRHAGGRAARLVADHRRRHRLGRAGRDGGRDIDLRAHARDGMRLYGLLTE